MPATTSEAFGKRVCYKGDWRRQSLKMIDSMPIAGQIGDLRGRGKFEASGIAARNHHYYVVFDGQESFGYLNSGMQFRDPDSQLIGHVGDDSQYESITYRQRTDTFFATVEAAPVPQEAADRKLRSRGLAEGDKLYRPVFHEVKIDPHKGEAEVLRVCETDFDVRSSNKGFEAMEYIETPSGGVFVGLCEGNNCQGADHPGHGELVFLVEDTAAEDFDGCLFKTVKTLPVPEVAKFLDYSAMSFYPLPIDPKMGDRESLGRLAIASQENAALWVGDFDVDALEFVGEGVTLHFPRDHDCNIRHCNIEGVLWVDDYRIVTVSDRAKEHQPFWCEATDQTLSMFMLPHHYWKGPGLAETDED